MKSVGQDKISPQFTTNWPGGLLLAGPPLSWAAAGATALPGLRIGNVGYKWVVGGAAVRLQAGSDQNGLKQRQLGGLARPSFQGWQEF